MLILASQSPRRAELLKQAGILFQVLPSNVKEILGPGSPAQKAERLALKKAEDVARRLRQKGHSSGQVLGADTLVVLGRKILGKPRHARDAARMLRALSGRAHEVITGIALAPLDGGKSWKGSERTKVWFRKLSPGDIEDYIHSGEPMDKAGAYGIQGKAAVFVKKISGDYFNVVGLPLSRLVYKLKAMEGKDADSDRSHPWPKLQSKPQIF